METFMAVSSVGMSHCSPTIYYILICNTESLPMFNVYTKPNIDPTVSFPLTVIFCTNVDFIAYKAFQTNKYGLWEGCLVSQKFFLKALIADVHGAIRLIKDVQHFGGILQPEAEKQPPASVWDFDGKTFLKWWIGGVECTGEATGDCC